MSRRNDVLRNTGEELRLRGLMHRVEGLGCHPVLTECVVRLDQALGLLSDWVDEQVEAGGDVGSIVRERCVGIYSEDELLGGVAD